MVTPDDIAEALGRTAPAVGSPEAKQWALWIDDARRLITLASLHAGVDLAGIDQELIDYVTREAVVSQVRQPDNATQVTVSVDDASSSRTYRSGSGRVSIADELLALLFPGWRAGGFTITPAGADDLRPVWWWVNGPDRPRDSAFPGPGVSSW